MPRPSHQDDREGADRELAREAEEYRDRVSKGKVPGAHKREGLANEMRKPKADPPGKSDQ